MLRAAGLMDGEFALRQDALDALSRIDREEPFAAMADIAAQALASLTGHRADQLRKLLDLIADGEPPTLAEAMEVLSP